MTTISKNIGLLPDDLSFRILRMLGDDELFDLASIVKGTEATPEQIAAHAARLVFEAWHGRMTVGTRDRIKLLVEQHFTPSEQATPDPLAESAQRTLAPFDPWQRQADLHAVEHVAVVGPPVENKINEDGSGSFRVGGIG